MSFRLTVLGCSSATPTFSRHSSAQILNVNERLFLIDCGEGAQIQMRQFRIKFQRIDHIFISHLHGDHYLGLTGLLYTFHLLGRTKELHIYSNHELKKLVDMQLEISKTTLLYPLIFHPVNADISEKIFSDENITVSTIPLEHRVPTTGFLFVEKPKERKIRKDVIAKLNIPVEEYKNIKKGCDYTDKNGKLYKNEELTIEGEVPSSYAYCSDTGYTESYIPLIKGVDLLYNESTFMHDKVNNAREKFHCTCVDAATIALKAEVKRLMLGHYSARYDDLQPLLEEAKSIFNNSVLAEEGIVYDIPYMESNNK